VSGASQPINIPRPNVSKDMPKELYISNVRRDYDFYSKTMTEAGFSKRLKGKRTLRVGFSFA
jgi:hypothetical protein